MQTTVHPSCSQTEELENSNQTIPIKVRDPKNKKRSVTCKPLELPPCYVKSHSNPPVLSPQTEVFSSSDSYNKYDFRWIFLRLNFPFKFPAWKGWLCATAGVEEREKSIVQYLPPINASITENDTVQEVLVRAKNCAKEYGQDIALVTFDLAAAKKAYNIVWQKPETFGNVSIHLGAFHIQLNYLGALGKLMRGSGIEEIVF